MTRGGLLVCLVIALSTQLAATDNSTPATPVFASNYRVEGALRLPYAELNEPFRAYFDQDSSRSRTDYYDDLYQIYQYGPQKSVQGYGSMYKMAWVPASFQKQGNVSASLPGGKTLTRRACFQVMGSLGNEVQPQTVLPNLADFKYDSTGPCPHNNLEHRHAKCELWLLTTSVGDKKNTYKMWTRRNETSGFSTPVFYYMLGYDSLLGSHYDRYDIVYYRYLPDGAQDSDFRLDIASNNKCRSMPGPGDSAAARRAHLVAQNPIHEYVVEPHRYDHIDHEFNQFATNHAKEYEKPEERRRGWHNFMHNSRFINSKNRELREYKLAVNRYADNNVRELGYLRGRLRSKGYNGGLDYAAAHSLNTNATSARALSELPPTWDWRLQGAVTPVKDQAVCGSCWSFGTSGSVEGANFVKTGKLVKLSQQQMIDCSWAYGNNACDGGEDFRAYKYIQDAGGLASEEDYGHYLGVDGRCHDQDVPKTVKLDGFYNVTANNVEHLKHAIITYGPVSVSIDASRPTFTFYSHGVYFDDKCQNDPDSLDHSVLAVGYAEIGGKFAWLVKNSWSTNWGNDGYILMSAEKNNCGVMDAPTVPKIVS